MVESNKNEMTVSNTIKTYNDLLEILTYYWVRQTSGSPVVDSWATTAGNVEIESRVRKNCHSNAVAVPSTVAA